MEACFGVNKSGMDGCLHLGLERDIMGNYVRSCCPEGMTVRKGSEKMSFWKAIVLGLVQGLTEFLPVSSSGHLILAKEILGLDLESSGMFFDVMLHFGTLLAIFVAFWNDIHKMILEGLHIVGDCGANVGRFFQNLTGADRSYHKIVRSSYRKFVILVLVSTIPTGIIGIFFSDLVEQANEMVIVPACCLLITAVFLVIADLVDVGDKKPKDVSYTSAGLIGVAQGIATLPGISRSGTTITACLLSGFDQKFAVKYSFIVSIPAVLGAVVLEIKDLSGLALTQSDIGYCILATVVAAVSGYLAIRFMVRLIQGRKFKFFAIYCGIIGVASLVWSLV